MHRTPPRRRRAPAPWILGLGLSTAACVGQIGNGNPAADVATAVDGALPPNDAATVGDGGQGGDGGGGTCPVAPASPAPLRRLTRAEYNNTVRALLNVTMSPADSFAPDEVAAVFSNNAQSLMVSPLLTEQYMLAAEGLSEAATANLPTLLGCDPAAGEARACVQSFINRFGVRAWRRPITAMETTRLLAVYDVGRMNADVRTGVRAVLEAMLQSPHFLYRPEFGAGAPGAGGGLRLTSYEVASRLSYFFWQSMPDEALFTAAAADALQTREQIETQARRLLADPRARATVRLFHDEWLGLDHIDDLEKDPAVFPEFAAPLRRAMANEAHAFIDDVIWQEGGRLETLLTAAYTFLTPPLAPIYRLPAPAAGTPPQRVDLDPTQRAGVLTLPGLMAVNSDDNDTTPLAPIVRGRLVLERLLCRPIGDPPPGVSDPPERDTTMTRREQLAAHRESAVCAVCHDKLDPIGLGFEHYDPIGRYVTMEATQPVNASGALSGTVDIDGPFNGAPELARRLASSEQVRQCVTTQWFRFGFGRFNTPVDQCSMNTARAQFAARDYDVRELLVGLVLSESFTHREPIVP